MKNDEKKYLNFPISLLKDSFVNIRKTMDNIFDYSICYHAEKHCEYGEREDQVKSASAFFCITLGSVKSAISNYDNLGSYYDLKMPKASVPTDMIFDFYKNQKKEKDVACFCAFVAIKSILGSKDYVSTNKGLIAGRMLGLNRYIDIDRGGNEAIKISISESATFLGLFSDTYLDGDIGRAVKKKELVVDSEKKIKRSDLIKWLLKDGGYEEFKGLKYISRRRIDSILLELQLNWGLVLIEKQRGFLVSFKLDINSLANIKVSKDYTTKKEQLKKRKAQAIKEAEQKQKKKG